MPDLPEWPAPPRPAELTYTRLVKAILDRTFPANGSLPAERQLAERLGVTRSTLREALQRLAAEGWIDIQQGKPTRVKDVWTEGNLNVLAALVSRQSALPPTFVPQLLEVREALAPAYTAAAVRHNAGEVAAMIGRLLADLNDSPDSFASADWTLHHQLTVLSTNPVYTLILNGFVGFYQRMARRYFSLPESRASSRQFYLDLRAAAASEDPDAARAITAAVMCHSIDLWNRVSKGEGSLSPAPGIR